MALCNWKLIGAPPPSLSLINPPVKVKRARNFEAPKAVLSVNRRDAMMYLTAEVLTGISMVSAEPAQARVSKLEQKRKIMEKLEKIREKAGVTKSKVKNNGDISQVPNLPLRQRLIEATLP